MSLPRELNEIIEKEIARREDILKHKYESKTVEISKIKAALHEAIDSALENYWKPKNERRDLKEVRAAVINFLNINAGKIFLANEVKGQLPITLTKNFGTEAITALVQTMVNAKSTPGYAVFEMPTDASYVQELLDTEMLSPKHYGIAKAKSKVIRFITSSKKKPDKSYFEKTPLGTGRIADKNSIAVFEND